MAVRISGRADRTVRNSLPCAQSAVAPAFFEHSYDDRMTFRGRAASWRPMRAPARRAGDSSAMRTGLPQHNHNWLAADR